MRALSWFRWVATKNNPKGIREAMRVASPQQQSAQTEWKFSDSSAHKDIAIRGTTFVQFKSNIRAL